MPYIEPGDRELIDSLVDRLFHRIGTPGEFNYAITRLLLHWWNDLPRYQRLNAIIGVLECVKLEFYRQYGAPYEDQKIVQNGPVTL